QKLENLNGRQYNSDLSTKYLPDAANLYASKGMLLSKNIPIYAFSLSLISCYYLQFPATHRNSICAFRSAYGETQIIYPLDFSLRLL
ncbi:MAG: hypothetical protein OSJ61_25910, partial [Lachnospiraceae bacterium]|nr:hypothetical protein [Lachnospiraceae bacterium]